MKIKQCYISKSINGFPFHEIYKLRDYNNALEPAAFFGCYRYEDLRLIIQHIGPKLVFWTGYDAFKFEHWDELKVDGNFTAHPKVYQLLRSKKIECKLVRPSSFLNSYEPQQLGPKIYAYCPASAPEYHGIDIINELRRGGYEVLIGDGGISQSLWQHSANAFYGNICVGLCLSQFAGGGTSIIEMGLRGIKVITNVFSLPNCIPWSGTAEDVAKLIDTERKNIGTTNDQLALDVYDSLDHEFKWLQI